MRNDAGPVTPSAKRGVREAGFQRTRNPFNRFLSILGPGLIVGASDDDPSGIGTYAAAGAAYGYATLWMALVTVPMMACVQYICSKIGLVTGRGLAGVIRHDYPKWLLYAVVCALLVANTINAGADIGAIAASINLFVPVSVAAIIVPIGIIILALQIWTSYRFIAAVFKWLTLTLFAYVGAAFFAHPNFSEVLRGTLAPALPHDSSFLAMLVAILGTTISPYMFFWQSSQEVEEDIAAGRTRLWQRRGTTDAELKYAKWDVSVGMLFSNLVMYFIILATAATLFASGHHDITSAQEAAQALRPLAGEGATVLFALGMIGAGMLAVPVLTTSAAYALSEALGWRWGLSEVPKRALRFYAVITASTLVGLAINYLGINPFRALVLTAVINGLLAPALLVVIMIIANDKKIMADRVNSRGTNILGWATTAAIAAAAVALLATLGK